MPVQRRKDTGAWEVVVPRPGMAPMRRSSVRWTHADALAYERKLTSNHHTLEDGLDKWLVEYAHYLRARKSLESAANLLRPFIKNKTFEDVPELVGVLRRAWSELQPATINRRMAILRRVCNLAYKEWRWIDTPVAGTVRPLRENNERHYYLTRAEVERLRMNCTVYGAGELIVLAAFTGLRLGEILGIRPGDVRDHSLHLRKTKNGRPRVVPLHPRAEAIAAKLPLPDVTQAAHGVAEASGVPTREWGCGTRYGIKRVARRIARCSGQLAWQVQQALLKLPPRGGSALGIGVGRWRVISRSRARRRRNFLVGFPRAFGGVAGLRSGHISSRTDEVGK